MKLWEKLLIVAVTAMLSILGTFAYNGVGAMSRGEGEALIEKGEARHEAKMDLVMDRLNRIEINQARMEEKVDAMRREGRQR